MQVIKMIQAARNVKRDSAKFRAASKSQKRVAIAKDAMAQLLIGQYTANPGKYVVLATAPKNGFEAACSEACKVCAIGSVMVSSFRLDSKSDVPEASFCHNNEFSYHAEEYRSIFPRKMLADMEGAFERWYWSSKWQEWNRGWDGDYSLLQDALAYISDPTLRLFAILENVIKNDGDFKRTLVKNDKDERAAKKAAKAVEIRFAKAKLKALELRNPSNIEAA
jgi:hypothetical protein